VIYHGPFTYQLLLTDDRGDRFIASRVFQGVEIKTFKHPVTLDKTPKIYVLMSGEQILYVGYTSQSISNRLRDGLKKAGTFKDYKGYKWKVFDEVILYVFVFEKQLKGNRVMEDLPFIDLAEAVEAELVYKVRKETGSWPLFQNEIHFNNEELDKATKIADEMFNCCKN